MQVQMTSILLKNLRETLVAEKSNKSLQRTFDPPPIFEAAKTVDPQTPLNSSVEGEPSRKLTLANV